MIQCHKSQDEAKLIEVLEPHCVKRGYRLLDLDWDSHGRLTIFIDHEKNKEKVTLQNCSDMSEVISRILDVEDPIPHHYNLEVSSPGLERPMRTLEHFESEIGHTCKLKLMRIHPLVLPNRLPQYHVTGKLISISAEGVLEVLQEGMTEPSLIPIQNIERAHRVFTDQDIFRKSKAGELDA